MKRYTARDVGKLSTSELRSLLGKYNKEARARISRLEKAGFGGSKEAKFEIIPVKGMTKEEMKNRLMDVSLFLSKSGTKVSAHRKAERKMISTMHERGFKFINSENASDWGDFVELVREKHGRKRFDSDTVARIYEGMENRGIDADALEEVFGKYLENEKGLLDLEKALSDDVIKDGRTASAKIRNMINSLGW